MAMTLITTNTSSNAATSDFTSGIDSTYKLYIFKFIDLNPATDAQDFSFQGNAASGSGYNETITSTFFLAAHKEDDSFGLLVYKTEYDQAQGTSFQTLNYSVGADADQSYSGYLKIYNPSSTTFVKHFMSTSCINEKGGAVYESFVSGYFNTTSAIDEIQFKFSSGNTDAGDICLYGITT